MARNRRRAAERKGRQRPDEGNGAPEPNERLHRADQPGSLDHAPVFRDWALPTCFADFRARLERQHGPPAGARQYARVLQLLTEHPLTRLSTAIEACVGEQLDTADAVIVRADRAMYVEKAAA